MHAFQRIFWKESRAQWQVWAGLLAGILLIQGVLVVADLPERNSINGQVVAWLFMTAVVAGVCYAAASAAILVAGEREDETDFLLRTFPIPRLALIGGKLAFTISSLVALVAVGFASAQVLSVGLSGETPRFTATDLGNFARSMGGAVVWGLFFSLLVDRVMLALGLAIAMEIVVVGILGNFVPEAWRDPLYWGIVAAGLAVDLRLAARWAEGRPLFFARGVSGGGLLAWGSVNDAAAPRSTRWGRLLRWFVGSGSPETRATGALLWRELRGAVPFMVIWGVAGFVLVDLAMRFRAGLPMHFFYLYSTPVICGLMTALGDQRRGTYRFLADHGVSPLRVWSVKIGTWLLVAVLITWFFGWYDATFSRRLLHAGPGPMTDAAWPVIQGIASALRTPAQRMYGERSLDPPLWGFVFSLLMMLFAVGQWASFASRTPVVAWVVAIALGAMTIAWHFGMVQADVPLTLATWPLSVVLLAATAREVVPWVLGGSARRHWMRRGLFVGLPLLVVMIAVRNWRVESIPLFANPTYSYAFEQPRVPWTSPTGPGGVHLGLLPTQVRVELRDPTFPLRATDAPATQVFFDFRNPESAAILRDAQTSRFRPHVLTQLGEMANLLAAKPLPEEARPAASVEPPATLPSSDGPVTPPPTDPVLPRPADADGGEAGGEANTMRASRAATPFDPATLPARWDGLLDLLTAAEYAATMASDWDEWSRAVETRQSLMRTMRDWGRLKGQTAVYLDAAIADLRRTRLCVSPINMLHRRNLRWQAAMNEGGVPGPGYQRMASQDRVFRVLTFLTGERARSVRLANALASANLAREWRRPADPDHIALVDDPNVQAARRRLGGWYASTFLVPPSTYYDPMIDEGWARVIDIQFQNQVASRAGTILCLLLERYRLEHGDFPADLATPIDGLNPPMKVEEKLLHDPYSGAEYQYRPHGFAAPLHFPQASGSLADPTQTILPAEQPLLWSVGPGRSSIDRVPGPPPVFKSTGRGRRVVGPLFFNDTSPKPAADEVRFLILPP